MKKILICAVLCGCASAGFIGWRIHAMRNQAVPHVEIVVDPSLSHVQGCETLLGLAEQALHTEAVAPGSTLTVLVLGDLSTAYEPWQLGRYSIPTTRRVLEGRSANMRRQQDVLADILHKCQALRPTTISPIFMGVTQAVADLRAHGCKESSHCRIIVDSDLEENAERSITEKIRGTQGARYLLPPPVNNDGIGVVFCGLAVTAARIVEPSGREIRAGRLRDSGREDRLRQIWRSLFTRGEAVRFEPFCAASRNLKRQ